MKILVLIPTFFPALGGAEKVVFEIYRRLAERHSIRLITPYLSEKVLSQFGSDEFANDVNFEVERYYDKYTMMRIRGHKVTHGLIPPFSLSTVAAINKAVREFKPDVLNAHYVMPTGLGAIAARLLWSVPTVVTLNGRDVPGPGTPFFWKYWHRLLLSFATEITYVSGFCREAIYGNNRGPGQVIYNGLTFQKKPKNPVDVRAKFHIPEDSPIIFNLQRLSPEKKVDVVVHSMKYVLKECPKAVLIVAGKGPVKDDLERMGQELGISDHVKFAGFVPEEDVPSYFLAGELFVFHSTYETFGMVLAEAMSWAKPIVSVYNTAIPEVVDDERNGLLVEANNPKAMGEAIIRLLKNPDLRKKMGSAAHEKATNFFDWDRIALQYEAVLEKAAKHGGLE